MAKFQKCGGLLIDVGSVQAVHSTQESTRLRDRSSGQTRAGSTESPVHRVYLIGGVTIEVDEQTAKELMAALKP